MYTLSRKKLPLYAIAGWGLNLLNTIAAIYLADALLTKGFAADKIANWTFLQKTVVEVSLYAALKFVAQLIDGIIDIPFSALTDNLKTKWGKRRPTIFVGTFLTIATYVGLCFVPINEENSIFNSIYFGVMFALFYSAYTLTFVSYYGSYAEVCENENDRFYLTHWKSFVDTVQYALAYAVIPLIIGGINVKWVALMFAPVGFLMLIAVFMVKERSTLPKDVEAYKKAHPEDVLAQKEEEVPLLQSIKLTIKNKDYMLWLVLLAVFFFGLQMFLAGQNVLILGPMGMNEWQMAICNSAAFAPVPIMLPIYRKVMKKKGFRFAFQTALAAFAIGMSSFFVCYVEWIDNQWVRLAIAATGATIASYGIGAFFGAPYLIPAQAAAIEKEQTGVSHPSMYFAVQGLVTAGFGALSTGLIWPNLRNLTVEGDTLGFFGAHLMPVIVVVCSVAAIVVAQFMPKSYNELGKEKK